MYAQTDCALSGEPTFAHGLSAGQPFNPYRAFRTGTFIPDGVIRDKTISHGAKLAYGRLVRYAGEDGRCFPRMATLASELGCSERTAQRLIDELVKAGYIIRKQRGFCQSNSYVFLWRGDLQGTPRMTPASTTEMSCSVRTSEVTPIREFLKSEIQEQASTPAPVENVLPACTNEPLPIPPNRIEVATEQEAQALAILQGFKESLSLEGMVGSALVREVLKLVELPDLPSALKLVDERIRLRRKRNPREYSRISVGFVVTVLREDLNHNSPIRATSRNTHAERDQRPYNANPASEEPLSLSDIKKNLLEPRSAAGGFIKAGSVLAGLLQGMQFSPAVP